MRQHAEQGTTALEKPITPSPAQRFFSVYPAIGRISMRARTAYRFDVWMGATLPFLRVLLAYLLWRVLFANRTEIAGFTLEGMTAYYMLTAFLSRLINPAGSSGNTRMTSVKAGSPSTWPNR